jgi:hypothetical protein
MQQISRRFFLRTLTCAGSAVAAPLFAADRALGAPGDNPRVTIGVLRRDGLLLPFASYDGDWSAPWPEPSRAGALPIGLGDVPKKWWGAAGPDAEWKAFLAGGDSMQVKLIAPVSVPIFCGTRIALTTDYRGEPFDRREPTVPKDGIAVAGGASVMPISSISPLAPDGHAILAAITDEFNRQEKDASRRFTRWKHPFSDAERQARPIKLEAFYRSIPKTPRGEWRTSYVEAVRQFPPGPKDEGCGLITFARGWVTEESSRKPQIDVGAQIAYCDRADTTFMLPFGTMALGDEVYWVYQMSSWRDESYCVTRIRPRDITPVVVVSGGMCPQ